MAKYFFMQNHRSVAVTEVPELHSFQSPVPTFATKAEFRAWCADANTNHCFYSMSEGDNPSNRVGEDNPVNKLHGFVADYDAPVDWPRIKEILEIRCDPDLLPTWVTKTQSGYARLVWEFEAPLPLAPAIAEQFMKRLSDALKASMLLAGFDRTSLKPSQYFELGKDWVKFGQPLSKTFVRTILMRAGNDTPITSGDTNIPIEDVAAEVFRRFPNRWDGDFAIGSRGPLFWIEDGVQRDGCQVREDGMICYSDRAGKGFVSWREILGKKFVEAYETKKLSGLIDQYWFNGKAFYKLIDGSPAVIPKEQLVLELRKAGFEVKRKKGQTVSEVENAVLSISNDGRIEEVAPVVFSKERIVKYNGTRLLNSNRAVPIQPASTGDPAQWPWLSSFLSDYFAKDPHGNSTLPYFLAWYQRLYNAVLNHRMDQGQLLILLGETGYGKTLLTNKIVGSSVGGFSDASDYLSGKTNFNKALCGSAAWVIDDQTAAATYADQRKFVELTKRCVANPRLEFMAKYADAVSLPWAGRVMMSLNMDANSLAALPTMDSSNRDKIIALRIAPPAKPKFGTNEEVEGTIEREMPYFLRWLLDYQVPAHVKDTSRFGVKTYIDPMIEAAAYDNSSRSAIAEMVEFFAKKVREYSPTPMWRGTLTEFTVTLHECNGGRPVGNSNSTEFIRRGMTVMEEICTHNSHIRPIRSMGFGGGKVWEIDLDSKYDIDKGGFSSISGAP